MSERRFTIYERTITDASPCLVVAELSHNHQGSRVMAREMIRVAAECGADAVKLQKRSPSFYAALRAKGLTEYAALREVRELDAPMYASLRDYAHESGLAFIVTAFDEESLAFLVDVGIDAIKAASGAVHNPALLRAMAATRLPLLLSTGCADLNAVESAMNTIREVQNPFARHHNIALLQCTSAYPTEAADMHLRTLSTFRALYPETIVGLSSHHPQNVLEPVAYTLGARIVEKHFTLSRDLGPGDHANSLDPAGLRELVQNLRATEAAMGDGTKRFLPCEETGRKRLDLTYGASAPAPMGSVMADTAQIPCPDCGEPLVDGKTIADGWGWCHNHDRPRGFFLMWPSGPLNKPSAKEGTE